MDEKNDSGGLPPGPARDFLDAVRPRQSALPETPSGRAPQEERDDEQAEGPRGSFLAFGSPSGVSQLVEIRIQQWLHQTRKAGPAP